MKVWHATLFALGSMLVCSCATQAQIAGAKSDVAQSRAGCDAGKRSACVDYEDFLQRCDRACHTDSSTVLAVTAFWDNQFCDACSQALNRNGQYNSDTLAKGKAENP